MGSEESDLEFSESESGSLASPPSRVSNSPLPVASPNRQLSQLEPTGTGSGPPPPPRPSPPTLSIPSCFCCGATVEEVLGLRMEEGLGMCSDKLAMREHQEMCAELAEDPKKAYASGKQHSASEDESESDSESDEHDNSEDKSESDENLNDDSEDEPASSEPGRMTEGKHKRDAWVKDQAKAELRRAMGVNASLSPRKQEELVRELRNEVRDHAGIPRDYPSTYSQYIRAGTWDVMVDAVVKGLARNKWSVVLARRVLRDIVDRGRQNSARKRNRDKHARGEPVNRGRPIATREDVDAIPLIPARPIVVAPTEAVESLLPSKRMSDSGTGRVKKSNLKADINVSLVTGAGARRSDMAPLVCLIIRVPSLCLRLVPCNF